MNYLERARCDFLTARGLCFDDFFKWHKYPVVARALLEYKIPAKAGDRLLITGSLVNHSPTSFTLQYRIINRDTSQLILTGETFHVFINDNNRPSRIPEEFYEKFIQSQLLMEDTLKR